MHIRESLILALEEYTGALLLVSHDRYFIECCVDALWLINQGTVTHYDGSLADYEAASLANTSPKEETKKTAQQQKPQLTDKNDKKVAQQLEREITKLQQAMKKLEDQLADPNLYQQKENPKLQALMREQGALKKEMEAKERAWLALFE
ncbi:MAG TPA: hypothetical protein VI844_03970 [Coxiellaceae bacterium]|nr:hypothetical protein [Coxiellaceae bacterium]